MKLVILAGGRGTRLSEETSIKPKPLVEIGGMPIIWHIMKLYSKHGINDFIICLGYKGYLIKEFFSNYSLHTSDITINTKKNKIITHKKDTENWNITLVNTGENTMTGGRILKIKNYVDDEFCLTYGDGLSDVNIKELIKFHKKHKKNATVTVVKPNARFGSVKIDKNNKISSFMEKNNEQVQWVNGGFFVLNKKIFKYLKNDNTIWEQEPLKKLTAQNQLMAFKHNKFWQPMDTIREKEYLEELYFSKKAPWISW
jgi:glucose-1-phosphate cytidylyltransferase